ncbi:MAG TPA: c-type cytochrome [Verrucomicrobiae bacterium]|nr:c-type cytochrome [Verrucomicrobiae bacterium]
MEKHLDQSVEMYGNYAPVRLPIHNGVPIWNPTAVRIGPKGEVFVANYVGQIYRIIDSDGDGLEDSAVLFADGAKDGLRYPTTMAFKGNDLYVGYAQQIRVYEDPDGNGVPNRSRAFVEFPCGDHTQYWTFGLCVAPDGSFYVNLSTDSYIPNPVVDPDRWRGSLLRISPDGRRVETFATGLRFAPGMAFDRNGLLFFSDNEGGGNPTEELNVALAGQFYGHNPTKYSTHGPEKTPLLSLSYGRGVCGIAFNLLTNGFGDTKDDLFVTYWGLDGAERDGSISQVKVMRNPDGKLQVREVPFCNWFGKPFDLAFHPSGDLYVSQFGPGQAKMTPSTKATGALYRFVHAPWLKLSGPKAPAAGTLATIRGDPVRGKKLFAERGCSQCHSVDGATELLGPNLVRLGDRFRYHDAVKAVMEPSHTVRAGFESELFEMEDGEIIQGRMVTSDLRQVTLMVAGNRVITLPREKIRGHHSSQLSLMPEGLLANLDEGALLDLFSYLEIKEYPEGIRWRHRIAGAAVLGILVLAAWRCLEKAMN